VAFDLFGQYGYERTTIDDIAKGAGISKGAVYLEFKTKEDILLALIHHNMSLQLDAMQAQLEACQSGYLPALKAMLKHHILEVFDCMQSQRHSLESIIRTGHRVRQTSLLYFERKQALVATCLHKAAQAGEMPPCDDYAQLTYHLMTAVSGLLPPYEPKNTIRPNDAIERHDLETATERILSLLIAGLAASPHPPQPEASA
jgi:AcrR family transcriptional regulator